MISISDLHLADIMETDVLTVTPDCRLTGMVENINILVESSQESLGQATAKIDSIDIETLNQSIQDLSTVIGPIARLFGG